MSTPVEQIQADLTAALKARDTGRRDALRLLLTALRNEQIGRGKALDDEGFLVVVKRMVKQRRESAEQFRKGDRVELADQEEAEIAILETYLPQQASEDEIRQAIETLIAEQSLSGPRAIGPIMQAMTKQFGAAADGATISRLARAALS
jgi:uncharacterized protein YqeY